MKMFRVTASVLCVSLLLACQPSSASKEAVFQSIVEADSTEVLDGLTHFKISLRGQEQAFLAAMKSLQKQSGVLVTEKTARLLELVANSTDLGDYQQYLAKEKVSGWLDAAVTTADEKLKVIQALNTRIKTELEAGSSPVLAELQAYLESEMTHIRNAR